MNSVFNDRAFTGSILFKKEKWVNGLQSALLIGVVLLQSLVCMKVAHATTELETEVFHAKKAVANVIWLPSERGVLPEEEAIAKQLAERGVSVYMPNLFASYFLPTVSSSLREMPLDDAELLFSKLQKSSLPLFVISANEGAAYALKLFLQRQQKLSEGLDRVGSILLNPNLYTETPEAGQVANYWSTVGEVNVPAYILQAELAPARWQLARLQSLLSQSGADVFVKVLPKVRDRFYFRPDSVDAENLEAKRLTNHLIQAMKTLKPYLATSRLALNSDKNSSKSTRPGSFLAKNKRSDADKQPIEAETKTTKQRGLQPYSGSQDRALTLLDLAGKQHDLTAYKGKVVLLNFWASWCPPCVHEIPSMTRLKNTLKAQPFEILAVNLAEEPDAVRTFLKEHPVNFPILLDPKGSAVKTWRVFAYPSSYVIDKQGKIRYALFGAYEWDDLAAQEKIGLLLRE